MPRDCQTSSIQGSRPPVSLTYSMQASVLSKYSKNQSTFAAMLKRNASMNCPVELPNCEKRVYSNTLIASANWQQLGRLSAKFDPNIAVKLSAFSCIVVRRMVGVPVELSTYSKRLSFWQQNQSSTVLTPEQTQSSVKEQQVSSQAPLIKLSMQLKVFL